MNIVSVARLCHEVNRAYCQSIGDNSQLPWNDAPDWQKLSAVEGVRAHLSYKINSPEEAHESWLKQKLEDGWTWGPVKDPEKKEHPCIIEYDRLPQVQRSKDYIFKAICDYFKGVPVDA